jgi:hypothetical protein
MIEANRTEDLVAQNARALGAEPANAIPYHMDGNDEYVVRDVFGGLTKREAFAAMAMQGLLSNLVALRKEGFRDDDIEVFATVRADGLLKELTK